jgi:hypothetical protein
MSDDENKHNTECTMRGRKKKKEEHVLSDSALSKQSFMRSDVFTVVNMWIAFFWIVALRGRLPAFWRDVDPIVSIFRVEDHNPQIKFYFLCLCSFGDPLILRATNEQTAVRNSKNSFLLTVC